MSGNLPEVSISGNADFTATLEGHVTPPQKTSNRTRVGEAQLKLQGRLHSNVQLNSKRKDDKNQYRWCI